MSSEPQSAPASASKKAPAASKQEPVALSETDPAGDKVAVKDAPAAVKQETAATVKKEPTGGEKKADAKAASAADAKGVEATDRKGSEAADKKTTGGNGEECDFFERLADMRDAHEACTETLSGPWPGHTEAHYTLLRRQNIFCQICQACSQYVELEQKDANYGYADLATSLAAGKRTHSIFLIARPFQGGAQTPLVCRLHGRDDMPYEVNYVVGSHAFYLSELRKLCTAAKKKNDARWTDEKRLAVNAERLKLAGVIVAKDEQNAIRDLRALYPTDQLFVPAQKKQ